MSTLSRYPWGRRHIGFVVTHVGLMTLLVGAFVTSRWGVDGSLRIPEGQTASEVVLPNLMIGYQIQDSPTLQQVTFERSLFEKSGSSLSFLNDSLAQVFTVERYMPFAKLEKSYASSSSAQDGAVGVSFVLKSQFFQVSEWLHSRDNPEMQLGPARLKLVLDELPPSERTVSDATSGMASGSGSNPAPLAHTGKTTHAKASSGPKPRLRANDVETLVVRDLANKTEIKRIPLRDLQKGVTVRGVEIKLVRAVAHAVVSSNKLADDPSGAPNPALEINVSKAGETRRDVLYARFPDFSLNKKGNFGLALSYDATVSPASEARAGAEAAAETPVSANGLPAGHPAVNGTAAQKDAPASAADGASEASVSGPNGNTVEFHVSPRDPKVARIVLLKAGKRVGETVLKEGETYQTPWMGMTIFVGSIVAGSEAVLTATAATPEPGVDLPPSAILIRPVGAAEPVWLAQGEAKEIQAGGRRVMAVFGNESLRLPFELKLNKFTRFDYPGTETAMSFESSVRLQRDGTEHRISMNEPLKQDGFTLYQASYQMSPGEPVATILSVNRDPGRAIKYAGSLILAIGIALFTLSRSRLNRDNGRKATATAGASA